MHLEEEFLRDLLDRSGDGVYFVDTERRVTYWNAAAESITGISSDDIMGKRCGDGFLCHIDESGKDLCRDGCPLEEVCADGRPRKAELFIRHSDGHRVPVRIRAARLEDGNGRTMGAIEVFTDNSRRVTAVQRVQELAVLAYLDALTGLGNRRYADMTLNSRIQEMSRFGWPFGVLFIDLDDFKAINDDHGHEVGDSVLCMVARTLESNLRTFDLAARWGGEELVAITANVDLPGLRRIAERFRILVQKGRVDTVNGPVRVTVSIGGTLALGDDTPESLVSRADRLMYRSKGGGKNRVTLDGDPR